MNVLIRGVELSLMPAAFLIGVAPQKLIDDVFDEYLEECFINSNGKSAQPVPAEQSYGRRWVYTLYVRGALGEWWEAVLLVMVMLKMLHQFTRAVLGTYTTSHFFTATLSSVWNLAKHASHTATVLQPITAG
jgi:hypothetical protein